MKIVLASASPRRIEILRNLKLDFEVIPSTFEEKGNIDDPIELVKKFSYNKALDVKNRVMEDALIIAADTVVYKDGRILGKPKDNNDAFDMLKFLSGDRHQVYTGVSLIFKDKILTDYECTHVYFKELSAQEIYDYINTNEPIDKAGAYAIQGLGSVFVEKIDGCYFNVVGLPIFKFNNMIKGMGINILKGV